MVNVLRRPMSSFDPAKGLLRAGHFQIAYATNDMGRACDLLSEKLGIAQFCSLEGAAPAGGHIHVELARVDSTMYELITATGPGSELYVGRLGTVPPKPRLSPADIAERQEGMATLPLRETRLYYPLQDQVKAVTGFNEFLPQKMDDALTRQVYLPAFFQLDDDEALIIETDIPENVRYRNFQLNDPLFNTLECVYQLSSTNGDMARLSSDGKFRAVISRSDPGVPNWLDPAGFNEGGIYGRWYEADSCPTPEIKRVKFAELRDRMPADTPVVTTAERREELARRVPACQRRRRW